MTRTIPVSGKYTDRQRVYNAVLRVKNEATKMLLPGNLETIPYWSGKINDSELLDLGLLDKADVQNENPDWPAYKNISCTEHHTHMGLDTHDYVDFDRTYAS
jgi:Xaa-Pro aminopeptidase